MEHHTVDRTIHLNDGTRMPLLGLGTWKAIAAVGQPTIEAAIAAGYRHIDTAHCYRNEVELGRAVHAKIKQGIICRKDMFIVSKLWCTYHAASDVQLCLSQSLRDLQLAYLDLYLIHFPVALKRVEDELFPMKDGQLLTTDIDYVDVWKKMEALKASGQVKSIGVSNFNITQLERLLSVAKVPPAVNQVELHPYLVQSDLIRFCQDRNIALTAYSPFGSPRRPQELHCGDTDPENLLEDPVVQSIAKKYKRSPAQADVCISGAAEISCTARYISDPPKHQTQPHPGEHQDF
ncbi:aldo-keto reductase family 1 member B1 isoform X2 [Conger conger]|uniref:aldo-keto reductase family 1 member B1 isoform X2 n=1 Tax=Conger conger TaxID=82655 RepID=UPI002A59FC95|nr:aldo-keto reductase family 1 member B1 isoform X2 [Conger conger]